MADTILLQRLRSLVRDVRQSIASRTSSENELATVHLEKAQFAEETWKQAQIELKQRQEQQLTETEESFKDRKLSFAQKASNSRWKRASSFGSAVSTTFSSFCSAAPRVQL